MCCKSQVYYNRELEGHPNNTLDLALDPECTDRQRLINYLVYMEGLSALVRRNVMHLGVIDDLFAYRFFIAVNNPVVQDAEILPYENFYQGCFWLSDEWTKKWRKERRAIPLDNHALSECNKLTASTPIRKLASNE